mgnify:FL=1
MSMMILNGFKAKIEYDPELDLFRGEILGLNGIADFYGKNPEELRKEFKKSLQTFLDICKEKGIEPYKEYSGKFSLKIAPELHAEIAARASAAGKSINQWLAETLRQIVHSQ